MFQPSPEVQKEMVSLLHGMGLTPSDPYTAIHIRFGGLLGERKNVMRSHLDQMTSLHASLRCALQLSQTHNIPEGNLVLITDNLELKALLLEGFFRNVLTTNTTPAHSGPQLNSSLVDARVHLMTVADMGVLAGARAIVADRFGGFGLQARLWGGVTLAETPDTETRFVATPDCISRERILDQHIAGVKT
ncbi:MAG: hypothetical protein WDW38_007818 [Sanguina aurantia]